jgi:hypothetical protein
MSFQLVVLDFQPDSLPPVRSKVKNHDLKDRGLTEGGGPCRRLKVSDHDLKDRGLGGGPYNKDVHLGSQTMPLLTELVRPFVSGTISIPPRRGCHHKIR